MSGVCPVGYTIDWLSLKDVDQIIKNTDFKTKYKTSQHMWISNENSEFTGNIGLCL